MARKLAKLNRWGGTVVLAGLALGMMPQVAQAQDGDERLARIETQLRALQRQVFPGGDQRFFEPEISAPQGGTPGSAVSTTADTSALTGMLSRLESIELQLARLVAATEVNENSLMLLEARVVAMETAAAAATVAPPSFGTTAPSAAPATAGPAPTGVISAPAAAAPAQAQAQATVAPTPERLAAVQAILKPATDDAGDDEYVYGFRLWEAGFYPEAQQQLALFLQRHPTHSRVTFGRNLLGRAFLDAGEPRRAATHFFENYQANKQAARAPDSLLYLAESMIALGDTSRACIALAEFGETFPALAIGRLQAQYDANRGRVDCQ